MLSKKIFLVLTIIIILYLLVKIIISKILNTELNTQNSSLENFQSENDSEILDRRDSSTSNNKKVLSVTGELVNKKEKEEFPETIIEKRIRKIFGTSLRMICNMKPTTSSIECQIDNKPFVKHLFPTHLLKLPDHNILAVFNDGRLYKKDSLLSNMWKGPLKNSMPFDSVPLRMVTIGYRDNSLLGIGYDNKLYAKQADSVGNINILGDWTLIPNNEDIIYCIVDKETKKLIGIDVDGKLLIKKTTVLTSDFEILGDLNIPILKLFYDSNGFMLALDTNFNLVQFKDKKWKMSQLNYEKGINRMKVFDILYDQDGKLYGMIFVPSIGLLELMKQQTVYFMSDFVPLEFHTKHSLETADNFVLNDIKIIELKSGVNLIEDNDTFGSKNDKEEDLSYMYMKSIIQNKTKLREFCKNRGIGNAHDFENYNMMNNIRNQENQISDLRDIIKNLLRYDPDKHKIQDELLLMDD